MQPGVLGQFWIWKAAQVHARTLAHTLCLPRYVWCSPEAVLKLLSLWLLSILFAVLTIISGMHLAVVQAHFLCCGEDWSSWGREGSTPTAGKCLKMSHTAGHSCQQGSLWSSRGSLWASLASGCGTRNVPDSSCVQYLPWVSSVWDALSSLGFRNAPLVSGALLSIECCSLVWCTAL